MRIYGFVISVQETVWFVICCAAELRRALPRIKFIVEPGDSWPVFREIVSNQLKVCLNMFKAAHVYNWFFFNPAHEDPFHNHS